MVDTKKAIEFCREIESLCPQYGCHVGLTGGTLYKDGERKDVDIVFYRIRQRKEIDYSGLFRHLESSGWKIIQSYGWVTKAHHEESGIDFDFFFPEDIDAPCDAEGY